jgi:NAD(P)-dependent dehydrogenase (short-subunit alcohol dehydrogenase family)
MAEPARVALVTGAGRGIGEAAARRLAAEGIAVAVADRNGAAAAQVATSIAGAGGEAMPIAADVSDADQASTLVSETVARYGRLDMAYNNAGVPGVRSPLADYPAEVFHRVLQVNLIGLFFCLRAEIRHMLAAGGGSIVNAASGAGMLGVPRSAAYVASKHAVVGLTRTAAIEYARSGIRVNAIAPGLVRTAMTSMDTSAFEQAHPIGRAARPEEIAELVCWLLSPAAGYLTGAVVPADGGLTAQVPGLA